jgi:monoterpene epsilon-lactone hydrolase
MTGVRKTMIKRSALLVLGAWAIAGAAPAQDAGPAQRTPPVPTDVSPQMQALIGRAISPTWRVIPKTPAEWQARAAASTAAGAQAVAPMRERLHVKVERAVMDGVPVFVVTPDVIAPRNRGRLLIQIHGGCYVLNGGEAATTEAVLMAGFGHYKVIAVDYRMPPAAYFPAALDDVITVWKAALKTHDPRSMGVFGSSAGGALTLEMVLKAKALGLPLPAAIAPGTPMADLTGVGDSFNTNAMLDNVLISREGFCDPAARFYANGHDLADPLLSPIHGDMHGFPPAILTTGTRDLLLSNTVRTHRKLRQAGVEAQLQVFEGQSHAQYMRDDQAPETGEAFGEIAAFFDRHLAQ